MQQPLLVDSDKKRATIKLSENTSLALLREQGSPCTMLDGTKTIFVQPSSVRDDTAFAADIIVSSTSIDRTSCIGIMIVREDSHAQSPSYHSACTPAASCP